MKAVILAGGLGTRLRPFTEVIPKPLLPIGEKAVLEIQIEHFRNHGFDEIILATNYKSDYIEKFFGDGSRYGVSLTISKENVPLGTAGPLSLVKDILTEPFVVMNGDILTSLDWTKFHGFAQDQNSLLTIAIKKMITPFAFGDIFFTGDRVTGIKEKPDLVNYILAGIYVMQPGIFDLIPDNEYFGMDTLIKLMLKRNVPVSKYEMMEYWLDIGRVDDYKKAQEIYNNHQNEDG
ncbi:MAG: NTP transferase domain-containing protein [Gemmatimonadales bacterium]|nr:NTP transferase domain-containing protein [Gemmatimonadales bacterium]